MSERANDQLADLIGSECNGHMQAGIASVTPDLRHIRMFEPYGTIQRTTKALQQYFPYTALSYAYQLISS